MHIGMVLDSSRPFPPDIRVEKEIAALTSAGYRVSVLTRHTPGAAPVERLPGTDATVVRVRIGGRLSGRLRISLMDRAMIVNGWRGHVRRFVAEYRPDVLHIHDFLMVPTVFSVVNRSAVPIVADLHENMPAALAAYRSGMSAGKRVISAAIHNYRSMRRQEAKYLTQCARIIVVVPEAAERLYGYGIKRNRVVVVSNTEDETTFRFMPEHAERAILDRYSRWWLASYIGTVGGSYRGLNTTLEAVVRVSADIPGFRLLIVGPEARMRRRLEAKISDLEIREFVEVIGWQPVETVNTYIMASSVCLVPHDNFEHTQTTIPHKLFQYMICGKPVLVSDCRPLARVVDDARSGLVFRAGDSASMAEQLVKLYQDPGESRDMGLRGQQAALGHYAWRNDADRLIQMYRELESET